MANLNPFDDPGFGADKAKASENPFDNPIFGKPSGIVRRSAGDLAVGLAQGAVALPQAALGIANVATGGLAEKVGGSLRAGADTIVNTIGDYFTGKNIGRDFGATGATPTEGLNDTANSIGELYSPEAKAAQKRAHESVDEYGKLGEELAGPVIGKVGGEAAGGVVGMLKNPGSILPVVAQSAPSIVVPAGIVGRVAEGVFTRGLERALAAGASKDAATAAGRAAVEKFTEGVPGIATAAAAEGITGGAQNAQQAKADVFAMPQAKLETLQPYKDLIAQGMSPDDARAQLADAVERRALLAGSLLSTAAGPIAGKFEAKAGARIFGGEAASGVKAMGGIKAGLRNAGSEAAQELVQSGGEQVGQNFGMQAVDPSQSLLEGVGEQSGMGAVAGGLMGGGVHALAGAHGHDVRTTPQPMMTPAERAGIDANAGPLSAAAAESINSGLTEATTAERNAPIYRAVTVTREQSNGDTSSATGGTAPGALSQAAALSQEQPAPRIPDGMLFPFATYSAAATRADALTNRGQESVVIPHPYSHDAFAVVPAPDSFISEGALRAAHRQAELDFRTKQAAARAAKASPFNQEIQDAAASQEAPGVVGPSQGLAENPRAEARPGETDVRASQAEVAPFAQRAPADLGRDTDDKPFVSEKAATKYLDDRATGGFVGSVVRTGERQWVVRPANLGSATPSVAGAAAVARETPAPARETSADRSTAPAPAAKAGDHVEARKNLPASDEASALANEHGWKTARDALGWMVDDRSHGDDYLGEAARRLYDERGGDAYGRSADATTFARDAIAAASEGRKNDDAIEGQATTIDEAAQEAATSPTNDRPEPTAAQARAGNYKKAHFRIGPLDISIENPEGSVRSDKEHVPPAWSSEIKRAHYGYVRQSIGADKDHIDAFLKPGTTSDHAGPVFVIDQVGKDGKFDETKTMIGYKSQLEAVGAYKANYPRGHKVGPVTQTTMPEFEQWVRDTHLTSQPFAQRDALRAAAGKAATPPMTILTADSGLFPTEAAVRTEIVERGFDPAEYDIKEDVSGKWLAHLKDATPIEGGGELMRRSRMPDEKYDIALPSARDPIEATTKREDAPTSTAVTAVTVPPKRMFVEFNGQRAEVKDFADASRKMREVADRASSEDQRSGDMPGILQITDENGAPVASVSRNGRVWPPGEYKPGRTPLYEPGVPSEKNAVAEAKKARRNALAEAKVKREERLNAPAKDLGIKVGETIKLSREFDYIGTEPVVVEQISGGQIYVNDPATGGKTSSPLSRMLAEHQRSPLVEVVSSAPSATPKKNALAEAKAKRASAGKTAPIKTGKRITMALRGMGGIDINEASDTVGEGGVRARRMLSGLFVKTGRNVPGGPITKGHALSTLVHDGRMDDYLPPHLRMSRLEGRETTAADLDTEDDAVQYLRELIAQDLDSKDGLPFDERMERRYDEQALADSNYNELAAQERDATDALIDDAFDLGGKAMSDDEVEEWLNAGTGIAGEAAAGIAGARESGGEEAAGQPTQRGPPAAGDDFQLASQTEADLARHDGEVAAAKAADAAEQARLTAKDTADRSVGEFTLSGSDRAADTAAAAGQQDLLAAPSIAEQTPIKQKAITGMLDVGENLWYNRRNFTGAGIGWSDVKDLNDALKVREVQKAKVWLKPDYDKLVAGGMPTHVARTIKVAYDHVANQPGPSPTDATLEAYIAAVQHVRDAMFAWARDPDAVATFDSALHTAAKRGWTFSASSDGLATQFVNRLWPEQAARTPYERFRRDDAATREVKLLGGNRFLKAIQLDSRDARKILGEIADGWPAKQQAWQRQGYRVLSPSEYTVQIAPVTRYVDGKAIDDTTRNVVTIRYGDRDFRRMVVASSSPDPTDHGAKHLLVWPKDGNKFEAFPNAEMAIERARALVESRRETGGQDIRGTNVAESIRTGPARRAEGEDITAQQLAETFGFRGVNFGRKSWINDAGRQAYVNAAYDGLMDLAEILRVSPKALSLNGKLGIAFGAQGRGGRAAAHFVPGVNEINLTKTAGAGTLAHEWGHALDHYFATLAGLAKSESPFLSANTGAQRIRFIRGASAVTENAGAGELRPEILDAFRGIRETMNKRQASEAEMATRLQDSVARTRVDVDRWLKAIEGNTGISTAEARAKFDAIATRIRDLDLGDGMRKSGNLTLPPAIADLRDFTKALRGRHEPSGNIKGLTNAVAYLRHARDRATENAVHEPVAVPTDFAKASTAKDREKKGQAYWATPHEMFARAFETYVADRLVANEGNNTFLSDAHLRAASRDLEGGFSFPYPRGGEAEAIRARFDQLVEALRTREENGLPVLYHDEADYPTIAPEWRPTAQAKVATGLPSRALRDLENVRALSPREASIVSDAIKQVLDIGVPGSALNGLAPIGAHPHERPNGQTTGQASFWYTEDAVTINERTLHAAVMGDEATSVRIPGILAHELGHRLDLMPHDVAGTGWASARSKLFRIETDGNRRVARGHIILEAMRAFTNAQSQLRDGLRYPLARWLDNIGDAEHDRFLQTELFAQLYKFYHTNPSLVAREMPVANRLMKEIDDGIRMVGGGIDDARRAVQRALRLPGAEGRLGFGASDADTDRNAPRSLAVQHIREGLDGLAPERHLVDRAVEHVGDLLNTPRQFNPILKQFQTQYHKANGSDVGRKWYKPVFDAGQAYIRDVSRFATDAADQALSLLPRLGRASDVFRRAPKQADIQAAGRAIFAATLGDVRPTLEQLRRGMTVKVVYEEGGIGAVDLPALTEPQIKLYNEARTAIDLSLDQVATSEAVKMAEGESIDDVLRAAKDDPANGARMISEALWHQSETLDAVGQHSEAIRKRSLSQQANEFVDNAAALKNAGYAPLQRFGQYTVRAFTLEAGKPKELFFGTFETKHAMYEMARDMRAQYQDATVIEGTMDTEQHKLFQGMSLDTLAAFADATGLAKGALFQDFYKLAVSSRSALKRLINRKGIAGYSEDLTRVLASFVTSNARLASKNYHFGQMMRATEAIPNEYGDVRAEARKLTAYVQNQTEEAQALRGLLFVNFIGGSVASALTNITQPIMMTLPYLSQFGSPTRASAALAEGAKVALTKETPKDPGLAEALDRAAREGITDPQELHQLYAESIRGLGSNLTLRKGLKVWGSMFSLAESFNRRITFVAAFRIAQKMSAEDLARAGVATPFEFAEKAVEDTQGIYNRGNRPNLARGALGATVFTFKQFSIAYLEFFSRLPLREKALAGALLIAAAGLQGAPGADDLEDLIDTIGQMLGFNTNSKEALRQWAASTLGNTAGSLLTHGISTLPGVPIDVQGRLGFGNLIPGTALFKRSEVDKSREIAEVLGPTGGMYTQAMTGFNALVAGNGAGVMASLTPVAVQNLLKGIDMWTSGAYHDSRGRKVIDVTPTDAIVKALGIQPQDVAMAQRRASDVQQNIAMVRQVESGIADRWARGLLDHDPDMVKSAIKDLFAWNLRNPETKIAIQPAQIRQRVQQAMLARDVRLAKSAPREVRSAVLPGLR